MFLRSNFANYPSSLILWNKECAEGSEPKFRFILKHSEFISKIFDLTYAKYKVQSLQQAS
jgi:hypothetical protein